MGRETGGTLAAQVALTKNRVKSGSNVLAIGSSCKKMDWPITQGPPTNEGRIYK